MLAASGDVLSVAQMGDPMHLVPAVVLKAVWGVVAVGLLLALCVTPPAWCCLMLRHHLAHQLHTRER